MRVSDLLGVVATTLNFQSEVLLVSYPTMVVAVGLLAIFYGVLEQSSGRVAQVLARDSTFLMLAVMTVVWGRLPVLWANFQLTHPDEPALVAQGLTLTRSPIFWYSIDGGTNGPLSSWPLAFPMLLGLEAEYSLARVVALVLELMTCIALFFTARGVWGAWVARVSIVPLVAFFALCRNPELVQYTSHHAALALMAGAALCAVLAMTSESPTKQRFIFLSASLFGALPMAKLQYAYVGIVGCGLLAAAVVCSILVHKKPIRSLFALLGGLTFPVIFIGSAALVGSFEDFFNSYVVSNLSYVSAGNVPVLQAAVSLYLDYSIWETGGFKQFFRPILWLFAFGLILQVTTRCCRPNRLHRIWIAASCLVFVIGVYSAVAPGRAFPHYVLVVVVPAVLLLVATIAFLRSGIQSSPVWVNVAFFAVVVSLTLGPQLSLFLSAPISGFQTTPENSSHRLAISAPASEVLKISQSGGRMAVWGYKPAYFVETGMLHGTMENVSYYQLRNSPLKKYYIKRFLRDLERTKPEVFLDVIGPQTWDEYKDRAVYGHEKYRRIHEYISQHYEFVSDVDGVRIYKRKG
jgi:hypothetical protein